MAKLSIVIPAYNEEDAIADIIDRCVAAKEPILGNTSLTSVEIIVVNDGSKDGTYKLAKTAEDAGKIILVSYEKNRNYGAAIKEGFRRASGDFLAFLDADGTCDPRCFVELFNNLEKNNADIAIGSRMGPGTKMPPLRRIGNLIFAFLINLVGSAKITDSASGMRVIRRSSLERVYPLPDGMHFTPAMSAKSVMDPQLKIVESYMPYEERVGESKLNVLRDGWRFFRCICDMGIFFKPLRLFMFGGAVFFIFCLAYGVPLLVYYLQNGAIRETDIYRVISIVVAGLIGFNLVYLGIIGDQISAMISETKSFQERTAIPWIKMLLRPRSLFFLGSSVVFLGVFLNLKAIGEYLKHGTVHLHWIYTLTGAFFVLIGMEIISFSFLQKLLDLHREHRAHQKLTAEPGYS